MLDSLDQQFRDFVSGIQPGPFAASLSASLRKWAEQNPIKGRSTAGHRWTALWLSRSRRLPPAEYSPRLAVSMRRRPTYSTRMDLYTMYLPRLSRWEAELAVDDVARGGDTRKLTADFEQIARAADRLAAVAESASQGAREVDTRKLTAELEQFAGAMDRLAAVAETTPDLAARERRAVLKDVRNERIATLRDLESIAQRLADREAGPIHRSIQADMREFVGHVEEMRRRLLVDSSKDLELLVDHAFLRFVELLMLCAVLVALCLSFHRYLLRR